MQQNRPPEALRLDRVAHAYGANPVLAGIDLHVGAGEVLALVGENGAGKSTLMKIIAGYITPRAGDARWRGAPVPQGARAAEAAGIVLVHQEFALIPDMTVAENILLGHEPTRFGLIDRAALRARARSALRLLKSEIDPDTGLAHLPVPSWQIVELAKAFAAAPRLLLMDEPTAVLGAQETEALFARIRAFAAEGGAVIFTSHRLDEVRAISDRVAVLRDGAITLDRPTAELSEHDIASAMIGREMADLFPPLPPGPPRRRSSRSRGWRCRAALARRCARPASISPRAKFWAWRASSAPAGPSCSKASSGCARPARSASSGAAPRARSPMPSAPGAWASPI